MSQKLKSFLVVSLIGILWYSLSWISMIGVKDGSVSTPEYEEVKMEMLSNVEQGKEHENIQNNIFFDQFNSTQLSEE